MYPFIPEMIEKMASHGFQQVLDISKSIKDADLLLKRQTWNTNRAIIVTSQPQIPLDFKSYLRQLRKQVAFRCGFFPVFWGIGIQVVMIAPGFSQSTIAPAPHVALVDNQWSIIQSIFLIDPVDKSYRSARTWGQFVTGKFQDAIESILSRHFASQNSPHPI
jgi:hypothetical protein